MKKRFGFTLAEVLITLGIIGVVAAMTIPTLIQNTNSAKFSAQFKKDISTLGNALEMAQAHYDITGVYELNAACSNNPANDSLDAEAQAPAVHVNSICGLLNVTLAGVKYVGTQAQAYPNGTTPPTQANTGVIPANARIYALPDGSWIAVDNRLKSQPGINTRCSLPIGSDPGTRFPSGSPCRGYIDVNGRAGLSQGATCNDGAASAFTTTAANQAACVIRQSDVHDIFPIIFHNGVVSPGSAAAAAILAKSK